MLDVDDLSILMAIIKRPNLEFGNEFHIEEFKKEVNICKDIIIDVRG